MPRKRARNEDGEFKADDPSTEVNEAWESGNTIQMIRPDKGVIDVPEEQVERYKKSDWKIV